MSENADLVMQVFGAVEQRDVETLFALYHPEIEFHEAASLPYGGAHIGLEAVGSHALRWAETWDPVQSEAERKMDPRVVAASDEEVVVLWQQRAVDAAGRRLDNPVLSLYRVRDAKLQRAQMFHFDTATIVAFLDRAKDSSAENHAPGAPSR